MAAVQIAHQTTGLLIYSGQETNAKVQRLLSEGHTLVTMEGEGRWDGAAWQPVQKAARVPRLTRKESALIDALIASGIHLDKDALAVAMHAAEKA